VTQAQTPAKYWTFRRAFKRYGELAKASIPTPDLLLAKSCTTAARVRAAPIMPKGLAITFYDFGVTGVIYSS